MELANFILILDILGTIAFAVSGVLVAMEKRLDLFGILIIASVTAIGGGTLRDLLIGTVPVSWMLQPEYLLTILISVIVAILLRGKLAALRRSLFLFDTLGIGLYTIVGIERGLAAGLSPTICIILGTMTASLCDCLYRRRGYVFLARSPWRARVLDVFRGNPRCSSDSPASCYLQDCPTQYLWSGKLKRRPDRYALYFLHYLITPLLQPGVYTHFAWAILRNPFRPGL